MAIHNDFMRRFGLRYPVVQAPMAGGGDTPELVAAASNAGAFGSIGAAYLTPEQIHGTAAEVRAQERTVRSGSIFSRRSGPESLKKTPKNAGAGCALFRGTESSRSVASEIGGFSV